MPEFEISNRTKFMTESATLKMAQMARELGSKGIDIINLSLGEPDFDTPEHIIAAAFSAIEDGYTHYPAPTKGIVPALEAIAEKMAQENNVHVNIVLIKSSSQMVQNKALQISALPCSMKAIKF